MLTVRDYLRAVDEAAPFACAEDWDNVGLLVGEESQVVHRTMLALDVTDSVVGEAVRQGVDLIITHHPVIFQPLAKIESHSTVYRLIQAGISVISAHTNLDLAQGGVNDALAARLGLTDTTPLEESGIGRIGNLTENLAPVDFAVYVCDRLEGKGLRYIDGGREISRAAVCGGSGADLLLAAKAAGAQAFVTGEAKHSQLLEAKRLQMTLIDGGHFRTETVVLEPFRRRLAGLLPEAELVLSQTCSDELKYIAKD